MAKIRISPSRPCIDKGNVEWIEQEAAKRSDTITSLRQRLAIPTCGIPKGILKNITLCRACRAKANIWNGAMECLFGRLKVEMFYCEKFASVEDFIQNEYISYWNNKRISLKLKGMKRVKPPYSLQKNKYANFIVRHWR